MDYALRPRNKHETVQDVGTPPEFIKVCQERFGPILFDLAADDILHVCPAYFTPREDALNINTLWPFTNLIYQASNFCVVVKGWSWLNPPYNNIRPFAERACYETTTKDKRILMLVPASVDTFWFNTFCRRANKVFIPRLKFLGHNQGYPKALMLVVFSQESTGNFYWWDWRKNIFEKA